MLFTLDFVDKIYEKRLQMGEKQVYRVVADRFTLVPFCQGRWHSSALTAANTVAFFCAIAEENSCFLCVFEVMELGHTQHDLLSIQGVNGCCPSRTWKPRYPQKSTCRSGGEDRPAEGSALLSRLCLVLFSAFPGSVLAGAGIMQPVLVYNKSSAYV